MMALNAKLKMSLDIELKTDNGSERQTKGVALNANMKMRLRMSNERKTW